jgi:hypothetical protein
MAKLKQTRAETLAQIERKLNEIQWGELAIHVQDGKVIQITQRKIQKVYNEEAPKPANEKY